jgi:nucleoid-associated protein YgaU
MATTGLENSKSMGPRFADPGNLLRCHRLFVPGILFLSCTLFSITNCNAQDVAEAAKQERARKEGQQKHPKHVYTEDDLRRPHILTPEDSERLEAKRKEQMPPAVEKQPEAIDAQSAPAQLPLGDIARQYRKQKQARQPQQSAEFHLPFSNPALATPIKPLQPIGRSPIRKDPFLRPSVNRPSISTPAPSVIVPSRPPAQISHPSSPILHAVTLQRGDSLWKLAQQNLGKGSRWRELLAINPGIVNPSQIEAGAQIYLPARSSVRGVTSQISVRRGDTLWKIAQTTFGRGALWPCIAQANPLIHDANQIYAGQELTLPGRCGPLP